MSSFLASIFVGDIAPFDISDVCGMNLWDIKKGDYNEKLLELTAGSSDTADLRSKLGHVPEDGGGSFGTVANYFVERYGFNAECRIAPFTGDNPSTILALPLRPMDAIVSLGTSTTFLMSTHYYKPDPAVHFFNHPTTAGLYMFMLCYKNGTPYLHYPTSSSSNTIMLTSCDLGGLAREQVRDALSKPQRFEEPWSTFNRTALSTPPLGQRHQSNPFRLALYFPRPEIVPNVRTGTYRYTRDPAASADAPAKTSLSTDTSVWNIPHDDARAILESQLLSLRLRSRNIVASPAPNPKNLPPQPRRIYLVGGGSQNPAIAKIAGEILGGVEGIYKLDVGGNACALGSAYKAVWACERKQGETFEDLIGARWDEENFVEKIAEGYQDKKYQIYAKGVDGLEAVEDDVLEKQKIPVQKAGTSGAGRPAT